MSELSVAQAHCRLLARRHYENFPVGRFGVPADRRPDLHAVYAFARVADDFADEPKHEGSRLQRLEEWGKMLESSARGERQAHPVFVALAHTIRQRRLPIQPLRDLLDAFRQDVTKPRYADWNDVLSYCRRSANPVGRLVLWITDYRSDALHAQSDALCTALQLTNFWQDLSVDHARGRSYLPLGDAVECGVDLNALVSGQPQPGAAALLRRVTDRTRAFFETARPLAARLGGRLGLEIGATWHGGRTILDRATALGDRALRVRSRLSGPDRLQVLWRAVFGRA